MKKQRVATDPTTVREILYNGTTFSDILGVCDPAVLTEVVRSGGAGAQQMLDEKFRTELPELPWKTVADLEGHPVGSGVIERAICRRKTEEAQIVLDALRRSQAAKAAATLASAEVRESSFHNPNRVTVAERLTLRDYR